MKSKEQVRLRDKVLRNGNRSLYLDIYSHGVRTYEFLRLYIVPETDATAKELNEQTMRMAESIKAQRIIALNSQKYELPMECSKVLFFPVMEALVKKKDDTWRLMYNVLCRYEKHRNIPIGSITKEWLLGLRSFLENQPLATNTKWLYWTKIVAAFHILYNEGIMQRNILRGVPSLRKVKTERVFLTLAELHKIAQTPCKKDKARRMFLFSCLTGMRYSDCISLAWSQVEDSEDGCRVVFRQQKTKNLEYISINSQARQYMGERSDGLVFGFIYISQLNNDIRAWMQDAGIKKKITFHCARHTFATLLLSLGTDIFVVSRLLGHTDIKTTQIYAHILDEQKREAVERIPEL